VLIDFGLARRYVGDHDGQHLSARPDASFRGSTAYASVHAHRNEDLSRRDDLWSWFYMVLELVEGEAGGVPGGARSGGRGVFEEGGCCVLVFGGRGEKVCAEGGGGEGEEGGNKLLTFKGGGPVW